MGKSIEVVCGALVFDKGGKILLLKYPKWKGLMTVPGGHINFGERISDAVLREVFEETGFRAKLGTPLGFGESLLSKKYRKGGRHLVFLDYSCSVGRKEPTPILNDEATEFVWVFPKDALKTLELTEGTRSLILKFLGTK